MSAVASNMQVPPIDRARDAALADARAWWTKYEWPEGGDEWSGPFGSSGSLWFGALLPRLREFLPADGEGGAGTILEIGPGFGRISNCLRRYCERLILVDLAPKCVEACRRRFVTRNDGAGRVGIECHVNDGRSLAMVEDSSVDLAVSYDALVHAGPDVVRGYVEQLGKKLRAGGAAFIHHSNLGEQFPGIAHEAEKHVLGGRNRETTAAVVREACAQAGLTCIVQELIPSGEPGLYSDCFSLMVRVDGSIPAEFETPVVRRDDWATEVWTIQRIDRLYRAPVEPG